MRHKNYTLCTRVAWMIAVVGIGATSLANNLLPTTDGWYAWHVDAVADARYRCCFVWDDSSPKSTVCNLDSKRSGYGSTDDQPGTPGSARIYAKVHDGELERVHAFSSSCQVRTSTPIRELDDVSAARSLAILADAVQIDNTRPHEVVGAIALHEGPAAARALVSLAKDPKNRETGKAAVFYMGQLRSADTGDELTELMFGDPDARMREHAAFSVSESALADRDALLVRLANEDAKPGVRGKAWFWLAQTESPLTEPAIFESLSREDSTKARHEAIFALAQLPSERAARALISVVEKPQHSASDRKQALFWLAQGESDAGLDFLSRVLVGSPD